jgi:ubiquinone/menaquinone biosynthesis C-methylase UbiE
MKYKSDDKLLIRKYGSKKEIEEYTSNVADGLSLLEKKVILKHAKRGSVLVVGCGAGRESIALAKKGFRIVGIDIVPKMVLSAKESSKVHGVSEKTKFEVADARNLIYDDESYDTVIMVGNMIEHVRGRKNRVMLLRELKRVLKPKGVLIFSTHTRIYKLRYRLYWTFVNGFRAAGRELRGKYKGLELGDRYTKSVSRARSKGKVFIHIYTYEEALQDVRSALLRFVAARCAYEVEKGIKKLEKRKRASQVLYVTKKS